MWPKIILINIDNFNRFGTDLPILDFKIRDKTGEYEVDIFHSYNIVLKNLKHPNYNIDKEVTKYLEFITSKEFSKLKMIAEGDEDYMAAFRKVEDLSTNPNFIGYYDYEQAHQDDIEMTEYNGMKKWIEQGIEQNKKEMVISMKEEGLTLEIISKITKLPIEEVEKILNN